MKATCWRACLTRCAHSTTRSIGVAVVAHRTLGEDPICIANNSLTARTTGSSPRYSSCACCSGRSGSSFDVVVETLDDVACCGGFLEVGCFLSMNLLFDRCLYSLSLHCGQRCLSYHVAIKDAFPIDSVSQVTPQLLVVWYSSFRIAGSLPGAIWWDVLCHAASMLSRATLVTLYQSAVALQTSNQDRRRR